jgi:hypothetical protein
MVPRRIYGIAAIAHEVGAKCVTIETAWQLGKLAAPTERLAIGPGVALV